MSLTPIYLIANVDSHQTISSCPTKENRMVPYNGPAFGHAQLDIDLDQSVHHQPSPKVTLLLTSENPQKHVIKNTVKHWWSNSIGGQTVFTTSHPAAKTIGWLEPKKQYHPWKRRKNQSTTPPSFCEFQPLVAFRKRGLHRFGSASIRGVLPN